MPRKPTRTSSAKCCGGTCQYGTYTEHGTMFVGFSADQARLARMLESMAGLIGGQRDALTDYTHPVTGAYYFVPSIESLAPPEEE